MSDKADSHDRCYTGCLTSADRLYLDRLWQQMGVDPLSEMVAAVEARIVRSTLSHIYGELQTMRRDFDRKQAKL